MDQPAMESMNTRQAADAIEAMLGDAPEAEQVEETPETEEVEEVEEVEASDAEEEEGEETAESEEVEDSDEEQGSIETLSELAEALDLPLEEVMANLKTTVKVNGEEQTVTLKEAFDGYQKDADYRNKTTELAEKRRQFEQAEQQRLGILEQEYQRVGYLVGQLENMVVPQMDANQLDYLKQTDPSQYLIAKQEIDEKRRMVESLKNEASQKLQQLEQIRSVQQQQQMKQILEQAVQELPTRVPSWGKETKQAIDEYLTSDHYGYSDAELASVMDPRLVELAWKAWQFDQGKAKADTVKKKVKTLPKVQSPAKQASKVAVKNSKLKAAQSKLKSTGSYKDAASLIEQLL